VVPLGDRAIGNLQQLLIGTYHGVSKAQLQVYLDEFVFRHNRSTATDGRLSDVAWPRDRTRSHSAAIALPKDIFRSGARLLAKVMSMTLRGDGSRRNIAGV
jgi:hypothetical protein